MKGNGSCNMKSVDGMKFDKLTNLGKKQKS